MVFREIVQEHTSLRQEILQAAAGDVDWSLFNEAPPIYHEPLGKHHMQKI
jgi:hypothetical protein